MLLLRPWYHQEFIDIILHVLVISSSIICYSSNMHEIPLFMNSFFVKPFLRILY